SGATELDGGLAQLQDGAGELRAGLGTLDDGAHELASGLSDGVDRVPALTEDQRDEAALVMSRPVEAVMQVDNSAEVYGRGMAPMFFSIALWVFGIAAFNIMRPISGRLLAGRRNPVAIALAAWLPVGIVAVGGGLLMLAATLPLGLAPVHPVRAVALTVLVAVVFSLIAHLVQTALGTPGSALLLVLLVLQLASTGGTYPAEVLPGFFQALHPFMPMSYSIEAFRNAISGGPDQRFWVPVVVLMSIGAAALALDVLVVRRRRRFRMKDLHPALQA
ncbi:YhgE/Pip family protein, partial [Micrococcus luteus]